jgi:hypothetical protein
MVHLYGDLVRAFQGFLGLAGEFFRVHKYLLDVVMLYDKCKADAIDKYIE